MHVKMFHFGKIIKFKFASNLLIYIEQIIALCFCYEILQRWWWTWFAYFIKSCKALEISLICVLRRLVFQVQRSQSAPPRNHNKEKWVTVAFSFYSKIEMIKLCQAACNHNHIGVTCICISSPWVFAWKGNWPIKTERICILGSVRPEFQCDLRHSHIEQTKIVVIRHVCCCNACFASAKRTCVWRFAPHSTRIVC